jgi:hypothetical protein
MCLPVVRRHRQGAKAILRVSGMGSNKLVHPESAALRSLETETEPQTGRLLRMAARQSNAVLALLVTK